MPRTEADGVARFDWIPADLSESHVARRPFGPLSLGPGHPSNRVGATSRRWSDSPRKVTLRGQVLKPDGTPAAGVLVEAGGVGKDMSDEYDRGYARTDGDGTFAIPVAPDHSYMVGVHDGAWAARSLTNIVLRREGGEYELPKLRLVKGTLIEGRLTRGPDRKPAANEWVSLDGTRRAASPRLQPFTSGRPRMARSRREDRRFRPLHVPGRPGRIPAPAARRAQARN